MPEAPAHPDPTLQAAALRYAAGDLSSAESAAFEVRLAEDQDARDALSEAVRLSAAALGQDPPSPHRSFRVAIRERLVGWCPDWLARRAYRGHPAVWAATGAAVVAGFTLVGLALADREPRQAADVAPTPTARTNPPSPRPIAPEPREAESPVSAELVPPAGDAEVQSVAELWAELSTAEHVEKAHEDEMRWRQKFRDVAPVGRGAPVSAAANPDN